ncbi:hypothetical protein [Paraburkholderia aromaticivorans]|uniref:hypothetical protein n=1 Tax=Paraburkholderia aromaticivorans TaxID=2026199 RepID=UPI0012FD914C|nr:hypothetical protein [Paraburkholderia aromaticivorans]
MAGDYWLGYVSVYAVGRLRNEFLMHLGTTMKYFRILLADGVYHYATGNSAKEVRTKFERDHLSLPKVSRVKFRGYA